MTHITIEIEPSPDGKHCGDCHLAERGGWCSAFDVRLEGSIGRWDCCSECLAARVPAEIKRLQADARAFRALVEIAHDVSSDTYRIGIAPGEYPVILWYTGIGRHDQPDAYREEEHCSAATTTLAAALSEAWKAAHEGGDNE